ncbi:hypothetical protein GCM10009846_06510 [Agrococcus versicolor]|uniref:Glycosyltransferase n=1 Tax=Agrococcus versicolor TaxID=501482 RepID=A0ABP5MF24_9MICO
MRGRGLLRSGRSWLRDSIAALARRRFASGRIPLRVVAGTPGHDGLPVLMCTWARIERLAETIAELDEQRGVDRPIDLYVWNNRRDRHDDVVAIATAAARSGSLRSISIVRSPVNLSSVARFYVARRLVLDGATGPFVVVDDDLRLPDDLARVALEAYAPRSAAGFWAWTVDGPYWARTRAEVGDRVDHLGPAGMVADLEILRDRAFFDDLPVDDWSMDDVWLSHWMLAHGMPMRRLPIDIDFLEDEHNMYPTLVDRKVDFHDRLRRERER